MGILVEQGGLLTTVQDGGRIGGRQFGVPQSGAVDRWSLALANLLVDNGADEAVLELTALGPRLIFTAATCIAIAGANLSPLLNGTPCPMLRAVAIQSGDVLAFGACRSGCRAYLAFAGGLDIPPVMGSRSTYLKAALGGLDGRALRPGDRIAFRAPRQTLPNLPWRALPQQDYADALTLRAVPGPQQDHFTGRGMETFWNAAYTVSRQSDRMGCRLEGARIEHAGDGNILSDGVTFGSVQVPENGLPIIMLADHQTTGGYAKIATVITTDLPRIAQCKGGERVRFRSVSVEEAQVIYLQRQKLLRELPRRWTGGAKCAKKLTVVVNGTPYHVTVEPYPTDV